MLFADIMSKEIKRKGKINNIEINVDWKNENTL